MSITTSADTIGSLMAELATPEAQADPYPVYARMHELGDAMTMPDGTVVVTGYQACSAVLRDNRLRKSPGEVLTAAGYPDWLERPSLRMLFGSMLMLNPPAHARLRGLVSRSFTAHRVAQLRDSVQRIADELLDQLPGTVEFVDQVAFPFPVAVIGELLGIPAEDRSMFQPWVRDWTSVLEILNPLAVDTADAAAVQIDAYLRTLARKRRTNPTDDLISALAAQEGSGECLSEDEVVTMAALILGAGFETTTGLLSNGLLALIRSPEQAALLRSRPELAGGAVEELLRYDTPIQMLYGRTAVEDMLVGELEVSTGQRLLTIVGAANRDPQQFSDPERLLLDRDEGRPLSFGGGIHHCLGAALARLETQVMILELVRRYPNVRLAGEPVRRTGLLIRGYTSLPLALDGRK
jgi:cytochrome P450